MFVSGSPRLVSPRRAVWGCAVWAGLILLSFAVPCRAQHAGMESDRPLETLQLKPIERNTLPSALVPGPPRHHDLVDYFSAANNELVFRFQRAREVYERAETRPFRMVTLVAGSAGVGKTFLKNQIFSKDYPPGDVCRFDIRDLYRQWEQQEKAFEKPDLHGGGVVLNTLPALREPAWPGLYEYLRDQQAAFYVIDSLDEIHPDDYFGVLEQVERYALQSDRRFVHIVVLGRGLAFRDYWQKKAGYYPSGNLNLYMLEPPVFETTGDLLVSSWNYHRFFHKLSWSDPDAGEFTLRDYADWATQSYRRTGRFNNVSTVPADAVNGRVEQTLVAWAKEHPYLNGLLRNLGGNAILRQIVRDRVLAGLPYDERAIQLAYLEAWLERDTESDNRPSVAKPEHLELYMRLLEGIAAKVLHEQRTDARGFFLIEDKETIQVDHHGRSLAFPAYRVLNRSGLKYTDPRTPGARRYRFEPVWLHRLLVDLHNERLAAAAAELAVRIDAEANIRVGGRNLTLAEFAAVLRESRKRRGGPLRLDIDAHHRCAFDKLVRVLEAGYEAQVTDIHLHVNGDPPAALRVLEPGEQEADRTVAAPSSESDSN